MITDACLGALRVAATLAHVLPVQVRLRHHEQVLVEVGSHPATASDTGRAMTPCAFRRSVARAWSARRAGQRLAMRAVDADPAVDLGVPSGGRTLPGGIHLLACGTMTVLATATTASPEVARHAAGRRGLGVHVDAATDVVVIHTSVAATADHVEPMERLRDALAEVSVAELRATLETVPCDDRNG